MTEQPNDPKIEYAILVWAKAVCIEMIGNDCWKHNRDYKAVPFLIKKWLSHRPDKEVEQKLIEIEDCLIDNEIIDWNLLEDIRILAHNYLEEIEDGRYNPDPDHGGFLTLPDTWIIHRIRELTDS